MESMTVREWRRAREISQAAMAELLGVHVNTYAEWEKSPENITIKNAFSICNILNAPFDTVIFLPERPTKMQCLKMPRVKLNQKKYMVNDLSTFIIRQMKANGMNQTELARACGHPQTTMSYRIREHQLSVEDLITIFTLFDIPVETIGNLLKEKK